MNGDWEEAHGTYEFWVAVDGEQICIKTVSLAAAQALWDALWAGDVQMVSARP